MNLVKRNRISLYLFIVFTVVLVWIFALGTALYIRGTQLLTALPLTDAERQSALAVYRAGQPAMPRLHSYAPCAQYAPQPPSIAARSAVVIEAESGALLFAKNPDQSIPPASLTKLVTIYTVMQAVERGEIGLTDTISPPSASWAVNIPPGSSLMFLGKNQQVSVAELILGMSVVSGNDAALALAIHVAGSVPAFAARMNTAMQELGLENTYFEEPSGLSENNRTTARDFARFSAFYINKYPGHLRQFHAVREFSYPQKHNTLTGQPAIRQKATNTLLSKLEGCDGLKTGFIYESGFNIALTAQRNGIRFIAVILGGAGKTSKEGKLIREYNGIALIEWAFAHFSTVYTQDIPADIPVVPVLGSRSSTRAVSPLIGTHHGTKGVFTVRQEQGGQRGGTKPALYPRIVLPDFLSAPINAGEKIGKLQYIAAAGNTEYIAAEFPLIAGRSIEKGWAPVWRYDALALKFTRFIRRLLE